MRVVAIGILLFLAAVGQVRADARVLPQGLGTTATQARSAIIRGVYPGSNAGSCCWIGPKARLRLYPPAAADEIVFEIFEPSYALKNGSMQAVSASIDGGRPQHRCCYGLGNSKISFALPKGRTKRGVTIDLTMRNTFVPALIGKGKDNRHLSALLRNVTYVNTSTGESFALKIAPTRNERLLMVVALAVAALLAFFLTRIRPSYGVAALIAITPFSFAYPLEGTTITPPKVVLLAVFLASVLGRRWLGGKTFYALAIAQGTLVLSMAISSLHAGVLTAAARETLKGAEFILALFTAYRLYRADPNERLVLRVVALTTMIVVLVAFAGLPLGFYQSREWHGVALARIAGPLGGPNQLAGYLGVATPVLLASLLFSKRRFAKSKVLELLALSLAIAGALFTFSRGGLAALFLGCAMLAILRSRPAWRLPALAGYGMIFIALLSVTMIYAAGALPQLQSLFGSPTSLNGGLGTRTLLWHEAYFLWQHHRWLGVGPGNFQLHAFLDTGVRTHANSLFLNTLAEQGVVGLICVLAVVFCSATAFAGIDAPLLSKASLACAITLAFHQLVDTIWIYPKVGVSWWLILAIGAAALDAHRNSMSRPL